MKLPYAEDINYWKTGKSQPDVWIERAKRQIENHGGSNISEAFGSDATTGKAAFMIVFKINEEQFKIVWPVLPTTYTNGEKAAKVQAATMLFHDVKAKCIKSTVFGARVAFFEYLMLPDGRTTSQIADEEISQIAPSAINPRQIEE